MLNHPIAVSPFSKNAGTLSPDFPVFQKQLKKPTTGAKNLSNGWQWKTTNRNFVSSLLSFHVNYGGK